MTHRQGFRCRLRKRPRQGRQAHAIQPAARFWHRPETAIRSRRRDGVYRDRLRVNRDLQNRSKSLYGRRNLPIDPLHQHQQHRRYRGLSVVRRHNNHRRILVNHEQPPPPLHGSCHFGSVRLTLPTPPETAPNCNCSLCRRTGGIWDYYELGSVFLQGHPENTESYIRGDRTLKNVRCKTCGIVTHWGPLEPALGARHGVNLRNFEPELLESVVVRRFDGADTWKFLD